MDRETCPRCGSKYVNYLGYCLNCGYEDRLLCPRCGSANLTKDGVVRLSDGTVKQRYRCKDCGRKFRVEERG